MKKTTLALISIFSMIACTKKQPSRPSITNPEIRQGAIFKLGSYFVYKDSLSGVSDSFWVRRYSEGFGNAGEYLISGLTDLSDNRIMLTADRMLDADVLFGFFNGIETHPIFFPFTTNDSVSNIRGLNHFEYLTVNGKTYTNVYEVMRRKIVPGNMGIPDTTLIHTFYSPESGLIKFVCKLPNDSTSFKDGIWELERSNIIR